MPTIFKTYFFMQNMCTEEQHHAGYRQCSPDVLKILIKIHTYSEMRANKNSAMRTVT